MTREITEKNGVWFDAAVALRELARQQPKNDSFVYRIRRLLRVVLPDAEELEKRKAEIVSAYTRKDEEDRPVLVGRNEVALTDPAACNARIQELMEAVSTLRVEPIRAEELKAEGIRITPDLAYRLGPLLLEPAVGREGVDEAAEVQPAA